MHNLPPNALVEKGFPGIFENVLPQGGELQSVSSEDIRVPTALWVAQQIREAFPYDTAPETIVMERDSLFLSLGKQTLPNMGIKVRRIDYKCPWQNGVVERFNLTLQAELLSLITAVNLIHINKLLRQYREYCNTARPHMTNDGFPPDTSENKPVIIPFPERKLANVKSVSWVGGFHHSYHWAA